jgi:tripartite-type tricarboxylate transporter receptor subunit TctC
MQVPFLAALFGLLIGATAAAAQEWPARSVGIIVPFAPGSTPDMVARLIANQLQVKHPGVPFIVENKPGASGNLGTDAVAKAKPDGYTIGVSIGGPLAINTLLFSKLPYDPAKDLAPITELITTPSVLTVNAGLKVGSVGDLIALLKREPDKYNYGSIGTGSLSQLAMEAIAIKTGARPIHVPYPGSGQAVTALLRGDVQIVCLPAISVTPQLQSGQIKILAASSPRRSPFLPDIPTLKEAGIDVEADAWMGLVAPAGTLAAVIDRIHDEGGRGAPHAGRARKARGATDGAGHDHARRLARPHERRDRSLGPGDQGRRHQGQLTVWLGGLPISRAANL